MSGACRIVLSVIAASFLFTGVLRNSPAYAADSGTPGAEVVVLCYHSFLGKNFEMDFSPETFRNQLESIRSLGYRFVSFDDIVGNRVKGKNNILITIDDGNISLRRVYDPILKSNDIKPLLFIYPAITGRMHYSVTWRDLEYFRKQGATIGAHGYYHMFVNEKLYKKDPKAFYKEIYKPKAKLEQNLGVPVIVYGYPFGLYSDITIETLKKAGYSYAFMLKGGILKVPLDRNPNPYLLPRFYVTKPAWKEIVNMLKLRMTDGHQAENRSEERNTAGS